jgi:predicted transcriptional regulator of viral defense system
MSKAERIIQKQNGIIRTKEAIDAGIAPRTLYQMRDNGLVIQLSRGVYALADLETPAAESCIAVVKRVPKAVICLISALDLYGLTLQIPHYVYIALPTKARVPKIDYPPVRTTRMVDAVYSAGIEMLEVGDRKIPVYSPEKTLADCFKYRSKIGLDVALEAVKMYRKEKKVKVDKLMAYAKLCRVDKIMRPYLEAIL